MVACTAGFHPNVADGENAFHRIVRAQEKRAFIGRGPAVRILQVRKIQKNDARIFADGAADRCQPGGSGAMEVDVHLRMQSQ